MPTARRVSETRANVNTDYWCCCAGLFDGRGGFGDASLPPLLVFAHSGDARAGSMASWTGGARRSMAFGLSTEVRCSRASVVPRTRRDASRDAREERSESALCAARPETG